MLVAGGIFRTTKGALAYRVSLTVLSNMELGGQPLRTEVAANLIVHSQKLERDTGASFSVYRCFLARE